MKAILEGQVVAESDDIIEVGGYHYFPPSAVRTEWLEKVPKSAATISSKAFMFPLRNTSSVRRFKLGKVADRKTASDLECPHGVQFYDVVVAGKRHARNAWSYEAPRPTMAKVGGRFGFWEDVTVG